MYRAIKKVSRLDRRSTYLTQGEIGDRALTLGLN